MQPIVVRAVGLEPTRPFGLQILSLVCLPFHHARVGSMLNSLENHSEPLPRQSFTDKRTGWKDRQCVSMRILFNEFGKADTVPLNHVL